MCNIAGYIGKRRAAPILIDMMRREEGLGGGYYTGIATVDERGLHYAKVVGDVDELLRRTDAMDLPGATGIIHSRTPGGGDRSWSHPFISCDGKMALVANGAVGVFRETTDFPGAGMKLRADGCRFDSATAEPIMKHTVMPDGQCVHLSEVFCHQTEWHMKDGMDPLSALARTFDELPAEVVALTVHADHPGRIFAARVNQPMFWARTEGEAFLATTPTAMPDRSWRGIDLLPANAACEVSASGCRVDGCVSPTYRVGQIGAGMVAEAHRRTEALIDGAGPEGVTLPEIAKACGELFEPGALPQAAALGYMVLDSLLKSGRAAIVRVDRPGMRPELTAPLFRIRRA